MKQLIILSLLFCTIIIYPGLTQTKYTINGTVTDAHSGEALIGATIYIKDYHTGAVSNNYGFYSLSLTGSDSLTVAISYVGYEIQLKQLSLTGNMNLDIQLVPIDYSLEEVVIRSTPQDANVEQVHMSSINIPVKKVTELPVILGEPDVLKVVQLLPGVQSGNEGTAGFYVRGGKADQNLVQLDEATVYNPNHLLGIFSTFNPRALNSVRLIKGGFPAQYGGRLSSILDVTMKEGNNREFHAEGGLGYITTHLTLEGPIKKEEASFMISGRRTWIDLLIQPFLPAGNKSNYDFYDINTKVNWKATKRDRLFFSLYHGRDDADYRVAQGINYIIGFGNSTATLRWNHLFGPKLFANTSFIYNKYDQDISAIQDKYLSQTVTAINDLNGKMEFQYYPNPNHTVMFGGHYIYHKFLTGGKSESQGTGINNINTGNIPAKYFDEFAFYVNDEIKLSNRFSTSLGLRAPGYLSENTSYYRLEPRASVKMSTGNSSSIKGSYTIMNQFMHLVPSATATIPTDVWVPSTLRTKPQSSQQFALGYFRNFKDNTIETSVEGYYKTMDNQVLFTEGNQLIESFDIDSALVYGRGWSYGAEFYLKKRTGNLTGWISYTLSWTDQQFSELNFGEKFPFRYDRRHVLSVVGSYQLNERWTLSSVFVYNSGTAYTIPVGRFPAQYGPSLFEGNYYVYEGRNNQRLPSYHRLDFSAVYRTRGRMFKKDFHSEWVFSVYNLYSRQNPYFVYLKVNPATDQPQAIQVTLLPIIPSISYNFKF